MRQTLQRRWRAGEKACNSERVHGQSESGCCCRPACEADHNLETRPWPSSSSSSSPPHPPARAGTRATARRAPPSPSNLGRVLVASARPRLPPPSSAWRTATCSGKLHLSGSKCCAVSTPPPCLSNLLVAGNCTCFCLIQLLPRPIESIPRQQLPDKLLTPSCLLHQISTANVLNFVNPSPTLRSPSSSTNESKTKLPNLQSSVRYPTQFLTEAGAPSKFRARSAASSVQDRFDRLRYTTRCTSDTG